MEQHAVDDGDSGLGLRVQAVPPIQQMQSFLVRLRAPNRSACNLTIRMGNRRFTRLTNAFSKRLKNHAHHVALMLTHYNFCKNHKTLKVTPAQAAGVNETLYDTDWIAELVAARDPKPGPRGPYRKTRQPDVG